MNSSTVDVCTSVSWSMATSLPSSLAPRRTRWVVSERCPQAPNMFFRVRFNFTGRPTFRAAIALRIECGHTKPLQPKAPPMNGETMWIFSSGIPSVPATVFRAPATHWVVSNSVSSSPCQTAIEADGSTGLWCSIGVEYVAS